VGEEVMVVVGDDGASRVAAVVMEQKRGGWYTVRSSVRDSSSSSSSSSKMMKRRASQLQRRRPPEEVPLPSPIIIHGGGLHHPPDDVECIDSVVRDDEQPTAFATAASSFANIVDLDSILQSTMHQDRAAARIIRDGQQPTTTENGNQSISSETLHQVASCHSQYTRWLIFSDLHVMPSTLSTCLRVLHNVHENAVKSNSGIIFLGDFWHHRGFVRVDCLNAVLRAMETWQVPSILIPGNHDQIDWRGSEHALTPLSNAYRIYPPPKKGGVDDDGGGSIPPPPKQYAGPLILSHPTKFMNALFIPHTRDRETMKSILSSKAAVSSSALFVHADVRGASMNDLITSQHGLSASIFPADKCVYSGHFHKPHVVRAGGKKTSSSSSSATCRSSIRYVGSPYQTSFSESGQMKSLLLVDSERDWQCIEEIPIDIGPRHHRVSSVHHFLDHDRAEFRRGDKVAVTIDQREMEEMRNLAEKEKAATGETISPFNVRLDEFRKSGISVELRDIPQQEKAEEVFQAGISLSEGGGEKVELEDLSPTTTLSAYLDSEVDRSELGETTAKRLLECGEYLLREAKDVSNDKGEYSLSLNSPTELEIESVSVLGFGSFRRAVVYPLSNRGVLLLRGTNKDDFGSDR
jgi:DNA repair exonuclease SbcCD nuclease subunit